MRALETAAGAFGAGPFKGEGRPLMLSQTEVLDERAPHAAVACPEGIPFIAFEGCRERLGGSALPALHLDQPTTWRAATALSGHLLMKAKMMAFEGL